MSQKSVSKEQASQAVVEEVLMELKSAVSASVRLAAKLAESDETVGGCSHGDGLVKNGSGTRGQGENVSEKEVFEVREDAEQRIVWLNVPLVGRNQSKTLKRLLMTESVNDIVAVF